jgi:xanthine/CO dehydrogenase XdhC/CoxF family maturation factor
MSGSNLNFSKTGLMKLEQDFGHCLSHIVLIRRYQQKGNLLSPLDVTLVNQKYLLGLEEEIDQSLLDMAKEFIGSGKAVQVVIPDTRSREAGRIAVLELIKSRINLFVFGAGHIGQCVASLGLGLGYQVTVIDDRKDFASRLRFPDERIQLIAGQFDSVISELSVDRNSVVVIVTRGHQHDEICLRLMVQTEAQYIGMIGSRGRVKAIFDKLLETGVRPSHLSKIHAPIGLSIGAKTPQEIGVAIIAEIIACLNRVENVASAVTEIMSGGTVCHLKA